MYDTSKADPELNRLDLRHIEAQFDAKRRELGVADELKTIPAITTLMLVAFGRQGIKSIEDLAGCATDDLHGWTEDKSGNVIRHDGILEHFKVRVSNVSDDFTCSYQSGMDQIRICSCSLRALCHYNLLN